MWLVTSESTLPLHDVTIRKLSHEHIHCFVISSFTEIVVITNVKDCLFRIGFECEHEKINIAFKFITLAWKQAGCKVKVNQIG